MKKQYIEVDGIPAVIWGAPSERLYLAVHGDMSHKEDKVIELLAEEAVLKGYQVLSFDLPEHGDRKQERTPCKVTFCMADLARVMEYARQSWRRYSVFACSIGAYFTLMTYQDEPLDKALFLSPVVDMRRLIETMMQWFSVTPEMLRESGEIVTPIGKTLDWDYYTYVKEHPVRNWRTATGILYGEQDQLCEQAVVRRFAESFGCGMEIVPGGEHFFHTEDQLRQFSSWLRRQVG